MNEHEIQQRHKRLDFTYHEFEKRNKSFENWKLDKYYIFEQIGEGGYAKIYRGMNGETKRQVAIKVLDIRSVQSQPNVTLKLIRKRLIKEESKLMMKINSPNVLKCFECFYNKDLKIMIIEYCNQGSLGNKIQLQKKIPEDEAISILKQLLKAIGECHKQKIIHRDLKPDNILIHNGEIKIADFGFSKQLLIKNQNEAIRNTILGTPITMAPEVLQKKPYGLKADIWSIGIIFFWMIFGVCPFESNSEDEKILRDIKEKLSKSFDEFNGVKPSQKVKKFLKQVLVIDVEHRLGWKQILNHEIFKEDSKSLPNKFYRQAQIKLDDEKLFEIERQFIKTNESVLRNQNPSQLSQSMRSITASPKNQSSQSREQRETTTKANKITSQFQELRDSSEQIQKEQDKSYSLNEKQTKTKTLPDVDDRYQNPFEIQKNQISPKLPPKQFLQTSKKVESPQNQVQRSESMKKIVLKSLKMEQPLTQSRRNRSIKRAEFRSPFKLNTKNSQKTILQKQQTLNNDEIKSYELPKTLIQQNAPIQKLSPQRKELQRLHNKPKEQKNQKQPQPSTKSTNDRKQPDAPNRPQSPKRKSKPQIKEPIIQPRQNIIDRNEANFQSMTSSQVINMKYLINREQDELFEWSRKTHVQCLKTQIILNKIIKVIENYNLLDMTDRKVIEMMYLLCNRCRNNISPISFEYQKRKHSSVLKEISGLVENLYNQVTKKHYHYSGLLTKKQDQKMVIVKDWFKKKIFTTDFKKKDKFLTGVESMAEFRPSNDINQMSRVEPQEQGEPVLSDYTKQEQIAFTSEFVKQLIKSMTQHAKVKQILPYMMHFEEICNIKVNDSNVYNFKDTVEYIIRDQTYRQMNFK